MFCLLESFDCYIPKILSQFAFFEAVCLLTDYISLHIIIDSNDGMRLLLLILLF